jgi:hypothetical protein
LLTEIATAYELEDKPGKARLARELMHALD